MTPLGGGLGLPWRPFFPRMAALARELKGDRPASTARDRTRAVAFYCEQAVDRGLFGGRWDRPGPAEAVVLRGWACGRYGDRSPAAAGVYKDFVGALKRDALIAGKPDPALPALGWSPQRRARPRLSDAQEAALEADLPARVRAIGGLFAEARRLRDWALAAGPPTTADLFEMSFEELVRDVVNRRRCRLGKRDFVDGERGFARLRMRFAAREWRWISLLRGPQRCHWVPFHLFFQNETSATTATLHQLQADGLTDGWLHGRKDRIGGEAWHLIRSRPALPVEEAFQIGLAMRELLLPFAPPEQRNDFFLYDDQGEIRSTARFNRVVPDDSCCGVRRYFDALERRSGVSFAKVNAQHARRSALHRIAFREEVSLGACLARTAHRDEREMMGYFRLEERQALFRRWARVWTAFWDGLVEESADAFDPAPRPHADALMRALAARRCDWPASPARPDEPDGDGGSRRRRAPDWPAATLELGQWPAATARVSARSTRADPLWDFREELAWRRARGARAVLPFEADERPLDDLTLLADPANAALLSDWKRAAFFQLKIGAACGPVSPTTLIWQRPAWRWLIGQLKRRGAASFADFCCDVADEILGVAKKLPAWLRKAVFRVCRLIASCPHFLAHPPLVPLRHPALYARGVAAPPTVPLEAEDALKLAGFLLAVVRRAEAALARPAGRRSLARFGRALARVHPDCAVGDAVAAAQALVYFETWLRGVELVTLPPEGCPDGTAAPAGDDLPIVSGFLEKGAHNRFRPGGWSPASPLACRALGVLKALAAASGQATLAFVVTREGGARPANEADVRLRMNRLLARWELRGVRGAPLRIGPRLIRATASALPVHFGTADGRFVRAQLRDRSAASSASYGRLSPARIAALQREMPLRSKFGRLGIASGGG